MIIQYAKKMSECFDCKTEIERGEGCIRVSFSDKNTGWWKSLMFHPECYLQYIERRIDVWFTDNPQPEVPEEGKRRRKKKHTSPILGTRYGHTVQTEVHKEQRRLKALRRYHKRALNENKVAEIDAQLAKLEEMNETRDN